MLALSVLEPCGPLGVGNDLPVFPGGVITGVVVVGVPLLTTVVGLFGIGVPLPTIVVGVNITGLSVLVCLERIQYKHTI